MYKIIRLMDIGSKIVPINSAVQTLLEKLIFCDITIKSWQYNLWRPNLFVYTLH